MIEYDVFLSFSSKDIDHVRPIWQQLSSSGLRVFWSDESLKERVGQSFFEVVQKALAGSQHFIFVCSREAISSTWVKLEYETFFSNYHMNNPGSRRFIVLKGTEFRVDLLPPFLRNIQVASDLEEILPQIGGVNVRRLKAENERLGKALKAALEQIEAGRPVEASLESARARNKLSKAEIAMLRENLRSLEEENAEHVRIVTGLRTENKNLRLKLSEGSATAERVEILETQTKALTDDIARHRSGNEILSSKLEILTKNYNSLILEIDDKNQKIKYLSRNEEALELRKQIEQKNEMIVGLSIDFDMVKTELDRMTRKSTQLRHHLKAFIDDLFSKDQLRDAVEKYLKKQKHGDPEVSELLKLLS